MKFVMNVIPILALLSVAARAQQPAGVASTSVSLSGTGEVTVLPTTTGSGAIEEIACRVTSTVTSGGTNSIPAATYFYVYIDSISSTINVYGQYASAWNNDVLPFAYGSSGGNVGDSFVLPLQLHYSSSAKVTMYTSSGNGVLRCNVTYH